MESHLVIESNVDLLFYGLPQNLWSAVAGGSERIRHRGTEAQASPKHFHRREAAMVDKFHRREAAMVVKFHRREAAMVDKFHRREAAMVDKFHRREAAMVDRPAGQAQRRRDCLKSCFAKFDSSATLSSMHRNFKVGRARLPVWPSDRSKTGGTSDFAPSVAQRVMDGRQGATPDKELRRTRGCSGLIRQI